MRSIRSFLARHFGFQKSVKDVSQVGCTAKRESNARGNPSFGLPGSISNYCGEGQTNYASRENSILNNYVGAHGFNAQGIGNLQNNVSELNRIPFQSISHRSLLLFLDENGQAYDLSGRKWSPAS